MKNISNERLIKMLCIVLDVFLFIVSVGFFIEKLYNKTNKNQTRPDEVHTFGRF